EAEPAAAGERPLRTAARAGKNRHGWGGYGRGDGPGDAQGARHKRLPLKRVRRGMRGETPRRRLGAAALGDIRDGVSGGRRCHTGLEPPPLTNEYDLAGALARPLGTDDETGRYCGK